MDENMDDTALIKLMNDINDGFASIRHEMGEGFTTSNEKAAELSEKVAVMSSKITGFTEGQARLEEKMKKTDEMRHDVGLNTKFRKDALRFFWIIMTVLLTITTGVAVTSFVNNYLP